MKTTLHIAHLIGAVILVFHVQASHSETVASTPTSQTKQAEHSGLILRASDVLNAKLFSNQGAEIGRIRDVLLDPKTGHISNAVVGMGGWQGIREKLSIVPWDLIKPDEHNAESYVLHADAEKFKNAPTFEPDQWAIALQPDTITKVQEHYAAPLLETQSQQAKSSTETQVTPPSASQSGPIQPTQPETAKSENATPATTPPNDRDRKGAQNQNRSRPSSKTQKPEKANE